MAQLKDLIVNGVSRFIGDIYGNLKGNADTATAANISTTANDLSYYTDTNGTLGDSGIVINTTSKHIKGYINGGQKSGTTLGDGATAEGYDTTAVGLASHAEGIGTTARGEAQHVFGIYNLVDTYDVNHSGKSYFIEIAGNGSSALNLSNARTLDWLGNEWLAGTLSMQSGSYKGTLQVATLGADRTYTLPDKAGTIALTSDTILSKTDSGSGNAVTEISVSNHAITVTKGDAFVNISSAQTITGEKTFDNTLHIANNTVLRFDDTEVDGAGYRAHLYTGSSGDANGFSINVYQDNIANNTFSNYYTYGFDPGGVIWANNVGLDLTAKRLIYNDSSTDILTTSNHYVDNTKLAINSTSAPTENLYVNGTTRFAIGNSDTAGDKRFIIGSSGNRYLSFGGAGVQAYGSNNDASQLFLNYNGGTLSIGRSSTITCNTTIYGTVTASKRITGLALTLSSTDSAAHIQFSRTSYNYIWAPPSAADSNTSDAQILIGGMYGTSTNPSTTLTTGNATATFTKNSVQPGTTGVIGLGTSSKAWKNLYVYGRYGLYFTGATSSYPNHYIWSTTASYGRIAIGVQQSTTSAANASLIIDANSIYPGATGTIDLGTSDKSWRSLRLDSGQNGAYIHTTTYPLDGTTYYAPSGTTSSVVKFGGHSTYVQINNSSKQVPEFVCLVDQNNATTAALAFNAWQGIALTGLMSADYAEYCKSTISEPGRCVKMSDNETFILSTSRLERGCEIVSDTFGMSIGKTEEYNTPIAASGRVLAYPYEDRELFRTHIGWPVCSGPNGTVSLMTEEEEEKYPSRIIGTVWGVPDYESWGTNGRAPVNGRVWIRVR